MTRLERAKVLIELGCGTGMLTGEVAKRISPEAVFFSIEANPDFVDQARRYLPTATIYEDRPDEARKYLQARGLEHADVVLSALPWIVFESTFREHVLRSVDECLKPGGHFITMVLAHGQHSPPAKLFKRALLNIFPIVESSATVWRDMPTAYFYHCIK
jgi:phospholipid N-methyltransferase